MKRIIHIFLSAFALLPVLASCALLFENEDKIFLADEADSELRFSGDGGTRSVVLGTSTSWVASSDRSWCHLEPEEGQLTDLKLTISVDSNGTHEERTATVTVEAGTAHLTITVIQTGQSTLSVEEADYVVDSEGGQLMVKVSHNVDYTVRIPRSAKWIREVVAKTVVDSVHYFEVEPNEEMDNRSAVLTFESSDGRCEEDVKVVQMRKDALVLSDDEYMLDASEGTFSFYVTSSDPLEVEIEDAPWLTLVETKAHETYLKFAYDANARETPRSARIKLMSASAVDYVTVEQKGRPDNIVFILTHENDAFSVPLFTSGMTGTVYWGDGSSEKLSADAHHEYGSTGEYDVTFDMYGDPDELEFLITDITGITGIDLGGLR